MQNSQRIKEQASLTPLDRLAQAVEQDMTQVNALILEHMQSDVALIPQLARYLIAAGGKRIRPLLTLGAAKMFGADMRKAHYLAAAVEFIHTATLLHDDVVDESRERRGQKAANLVFGNQASVLVGDFLFSRSFQMMVESGSLEVLRILSSAAAVIAQGEVLQLMTANDIDTKLDSYLDVIESKTAALFAAACEIAPVLSGADKKSIDAMRCYGMKIGTAFQIVDDALDYAANQQKLGKEIGDDFREGKMTAPVIFALQKANPSEREFWQRTLGNKKQEDGDFAEAMEIIGRHNALEKTMVLARDYARQTQEAIAFLPDGSLKEIFIDLADFTVNREY